MDANVLLDLYQRCSKHSGYQRLAGALAPLLDVDALQVKSRHEHARLDYIAAHVDVADLHVADIGGNTGFFSFELLARGARRVDYYEGQPAHHAFVSAAAARLGLASRLHSHRTYLTFGAGELPQVDCTLLLNVLHHLGDDFGDPGTLREAAKHQMLDGLSALARSSRMLVFQLGFNWKGDRHQPLFTGGTKSEMIDFIRRGTAADWTVAAIGVAECEAGAIAYRELGEHNIERVDALGEFLNRPIFILESRHRTGAAKFAAAADVCVERA